MPTAGIRVLVVGGELPLPAAYESRRAGGTSNIMGEIAQFRPDVILTSDFVPGALNRASFELRKRWLHVDPSDAKAIADTVEACYAHNLWTRHAYADDHPLVSVYTPTYNTGDYLRETYQSLRDQSYPTWEWVVVDDGSDDDTWARLEQLAAEDWRVRPVRNARNAGKIGAVKDQATRLARGEILVELDHDDLLTDFALDEIVAAFKRHPDAGMVYSDCSNFFENGTFHRFAEEGAPSYWADRYHEEEYRGRKWLVCEQPDIYDRFGDEARQQFGWFLTMGPNHVRAYRASALRELGGYNPGLPVADDWDVFVRFFLRSKCVLVSKLLYLYRFRDGWANATFTRNQSIQDHLELGRANYAAECEAFNARRLAGADPAALAPDGGALLTVAVCAIAERADTTLPAVIAELRRQAEGQPVEILCLLDNRARTLSEKRNTIIAAAKGRFVVFADDDDRVEPDYVEALLGAIRGEPEADVVCFDVMVHGAGGSDRLCRYGIGLEDRDAEDAFYRKPNHIMAWRTDLARAVPYEDTWDEDTQWARKAQARVRAEARVDRVLYHYDVDPVTTTQRDRAGRVPTYDVSYVVLVAAAETPAGRCLASIRQHSPGSEIVLVANGVELPEGLRAVADRVVESEINLGFGAGCNVGAERATRPILCFLNDDAAFVEGSTPRLLAEAVTAEHPIVAPYSDRAKPPQGDVEQGQTPPRDAFPEAVVGLCLMLPARVFREVGGFDPRLLTWEDDDFCLRARALGHGCKVVGSTWVRHERHATFRALGMDPEQVMADNKRRFRELHPRIRVVAIAKDEAGCVEGFFEQFRGTTTDWCLLDTGSTDGTRELAEAIGVRVEEGPFEDFAQARNLALERFGAGADWVIMLDPDERLDEHTLAHLRETLAQAQSRGSYDVLLAPLQAVYPDGARRDFVPKPFALRPGSGVRWAFKVHEKLIGSCHLALVRNARIDHVLALHDAGRRAESEGLYSRLGAEEPYHADPEVKRKMLEKWPILDYDRTDDDRIAKVWAGPLVTVVIPTWDRPELLRRAVESAGAQDYLNLDIVVVHDGPEEALPVWGIREYDMRGNHGAGGAVPRNYALRLAAGPLVAYLDDDNEWDPDHVSHLYEALRASGAAFAFSSMRLKGDGRVIDFDVPRRQGIDTSCVLHWRDLVRRHGGWKSREEAGDYAHDWEFFSRWVVAGEVWAATRRPTLVYNAATSGQEAFLSGPMLAAAEGGE
ncbi:MAG TPA: glycosyltransferase [Phycisphaerae bacterium]|nr:glycosyltransferase [Phycisphaerae bacterium]